MYAIIMKDKDGRKSAFYRSYPKSRAQEKVNYLNRNHSEKGISFSIKRIKMKGGFCINCP